MSQNNKTTYLKDYEKYPFKILKAELNVHIHDAYTTVETHLEFERLQASATDMVLNGEELQLQSVKLNHSPLNEFQYTVTTTELKIPIESNSGTLSTIVQIRPQDNTALEGLYQSGDLYCTQNEPEGFRRITYFPDRPDVLTVFTTKIIADKTTFPVLLANGNCIDSGSMDGNQHYAVWHDPFPKPAYLYALVAGPLSKCSDTFTTMSGRDIKLEIFVDPGNESKTAHALMSLKKSMTWDETAFGREYDLDIFMIVAVDAFNMGAMENKGLNIFNSSCVLANPEIATDDDFFRIESIIAHEYFHNWTGNRITCRDWFQLTLKEGLTVYRDQEFSADMHSRAVQRIRDVRALRNAQFPEDDSPLSHPIKPQSYEEINNFYTSTIYDKGAEVIRMIHTLIGPAAFRKGMDIYFDTFDGQAVRTEDFVWAMEQGSGTSLEAFTRWYHQAGRPQVTVNTRFNKGTYTLELTQTSKDITNEPFLIPLKFDLLDNNGQSILNDTTDCIVLDTPNKTVSFPNCKEKPILSIGRDFSAPITLHLNHTENELATLFRTDPNPFTRFEAGQKLATQLCQAYMVNDTEKIDILWPIMSNGIQTLIDSKQDPSFIAECLTIPSITNLLEPQTPYDFDATFKARESLNRTIATTFKETFHSRYIDLQKKLGDRNEFNSKDMGERKLKNTYLQLLSYVDGHHEDVISNAYQNAPTMTDSIAALSLLVRWNLDSKTSTLADFYTKWKDEFTVITKWFSIQAFAPYGPVLDTVKHLEKDPVFDIKNPNKCRALLGSFAHNHCYFHDASGSGYQYLANRIQTLDPQNPSIAARLATAFEIYRHCDQSRQTHMENAIVPLLEDKALSKNSREILHKILD